MSKLAKPEQSGKVCLRALLLAQADALESQAATLRALAETADNDTAGPDPLLDADETLERHGIGRDGLKAAGDRGELKLSRGSRGKLLVRESELIRYLESRPYQPRRAKPEPVTGDSWDAEMERQLAKGGR